MAGKFFGRNDAVTSQNSHGDWEVERSAFFLDIRGGETDGDLIGRDVKAAVLERRADPFPGFFDASIWEAHQDQLGQAVRDVDFNIYGEGMNAQGKGAFDAYHKRRVSI